MNYSWSSLGLLLTLLGCLYFGIAFVVKRKTEVILRHLNKEFGKNRRNTYCYLIAFSVAIVMLILNLDSHFDLTSSLWGLAVIYTIVYIAAVIVLLIIFSLMLPNKKD